MKLSEEAIDLEIDINFYIDYEKLAMRSLEEVKAILKEKTMKLVRGALEEAMKFLEKVVMKYRRPY